MYRRRSVSARCEARDEGSVGRGDSNDSTVSIRVSVSADLAGVAVPAGIVRLVRLRFESGRGIYLNVSLDSV